MNKLEVIKEFLDKGKRLRTPGETMEATPERSEGLIRLGYCKDITEYPPEEIEEDPNPVEEDEDQNEEDQNESETKE